MMLSRPLRLRTRIALWACSGQGEIGHIDNRLPMDSLNYSREHICPSQEGIWLQLLARCHLESCCLFDENDHLCQRAHESGETATVSCNTRNESDCLLCRSFLQKFGDKCENTGSFFIKSTIVYTESLPWCSACMSPCLHPIMHLSSPACSTAES